MADNQTHDPNEPIRWEEWVSHYINATDAREINLLIEKLNVQALQKGIEELVQKLTIYSEWHLRHIPVDSSGWDLIVNKKWHFIGFILAQVGAFKWARRVYEHEYAILCDIQIQRDQRVHKGLPLHQMGWVLLLENTPETLLQSRYFIKLALIEDCLTAAQDYITMPAFRVLNQSHQIAEPVLTKFAELVMKRAHPANRKVEAGTRNHGQRERRLFDLFRPELIYLDVVRESGGSEESDYFQFDSQIAQHLFEDVEDGTGATIPNEEK